MICLNPQLLFCKFYYYVFLSQSSTNDCNYREPLQVAIGPLDLEAPFVHCPIFTFSEQNYIYFNFSSFCKILHSNATTRVVNLIFHLILA
jgi:hypothetical protein